MEGKHEKSINEKYGKSRLGKIFGIFLSLILIMWILVGIVYFFIYESINWFWKISLLDNDIVKIIAMTILAIGFLLNLSFTRSVGKSIKQALNSNTESPLITTGIYRYIRHPGYSAIILNLIGTFLLIPNLFMLVFLLCAVFGIFGHSREEEKSLMKIYGKDYEIYKKKVGKFVPKIIKK